jgi:hypothetical protein
MSDGQDWIARNEANLFGIRRLADNGVTLEDEFAEANLVAPLRAASNKPDDRFDISIDPLALIPDVPTNNTVWVDPVNGDDGTGEAGQQTRPFATMAAAIVAAKLLIPSATNPVLVSLRPGIHTTAPLNMAASPYITIAGTDGEETAIIQASTTTSPLITGGDGVVIKNVTLEGANGTGGIGVLMASSGSMRVEACAIRDCVAGLRVTNSGSRLWALRSVLRRQSGQVMATGAEATSGGELLARDTRVEGEPGTLVSVGFRCDDSVVVMGEFAVDYAEDALLVSTDGRLDAANGGVTNSTNGARVASSNGRLGLATVFFEDSTSWDILVEGAGSTLRTNGVLSTGTKISVNGSADWFGTWFDILAETANTQGSLNVGSATRPAEFAAGAGSNTTTGLAALTNDNLEAGTWTDVTALVVSPDGSVFDVFPGLALGNSFYIGADQPFPGLFIDTRQAAVGGTIVPKFWDGAWQTFDWMTTDASAPYGSAGNTIFASAVTNQMRFGLMPGWITKNLNGIVKYWVRLEVTSGLTTLPRCESMMLHANHTKVNPDGFVEHFGDAQPRRIIPAGSIAPSLWQTVTGAPNSISVALSTSIIYPSWGFPNNLVRQIYNSLAIPPGLNTALPLELEVEWDPGTSTNTGNLELQAYYVAHQSNAVLAGALPGPLTEATSTVLTAGPGIAYRGVRSTHPLLIPGVTSQHESLGLTLQRDGGAGPDTFTGEARIRSIRLFGTFWAPGEQ